MSKSREAGPRVAVSSGRSQRATTRRADEADAPHPKASGTTHLPGQGSGLNNPKTGSSVVGAALTEAVRDGTVSPVLDSPPSPARISCDPDGARAEVQVADPVPSVTTSGSRVFPPARLPLTVRQRRWMHRK